MKVYPYNFLMHVTRYSLLVPSRRGAPSFPDIDVVLFHPAYVHVPTPSIPPSTSPKSQRGRINIAFRSAYTPAHARAASPLVRDIVRPLEERGLIAASLSLGERKWQGIVRVPEKTKEGHWEDRGERLLHIRNDAGAYCRVDLRCVDDV